MRLDAAPGWVQDLQRAGPSYHGAAAEGVGRWLGGLGFLGDLGLLGWLGWVGVGWAGWGCTVLAIVPMSHGQYHQSSTVVLASDEKGGPSKFPTPGV